MGTRADVLRRFGPADSRGPGPHDPIGDLGRLSRIEEFGELRARLSRYVELEELPDELLGLVRLSPQVFNPTTRRLEFQRSANLFPAGRIVFAASGSADIDAATGFGGVLNPQDVDPTTDASWRLLGGVLFATAAATVAVRHSGTQRVLAAAQIPVGGSAAIALPGNGSKPLAVGARRTYEIFCSAAATIDFFLFVAEETEG